LINISIFINQLGLFRTVEKPQSKMWFAKTRFSGVSIPKFSGGMNRTSEFTGHVIELATGEMTKLSDYVKYVL
jgi:hypothetical protein